LIIKIEIVWRITS